MPRMVHRGKEKPSARGCVRSCIAGALGACMANPTQPERAAKSSQELDSAIIRLLWSVYHIPL